MTDKRRKTVAQRLDESRAKKNVNLEVIARLREELMFSRNSSEEMEREKGQLNIQLDRAKQKLAWAYGIMVVGFGLLGGLLLAVLAR